MHIASVLAIEDRLLPELDRMIDELYRLETENADVLKIGRTHLQDAVPIRFSQEISGWRASLEQDRNMISVSLPPLRELALGGTAVGTGMNAPEGFDRLVAAEIAGLTGKPFITAKNKFHALTSLDEMTFTHGAMKSLAADLMKMANDIRWLASGPRCG
ncbi:MAG: class II fumarate hydratase, partial [Lachnospiraceae bacterium]|nr:class II fumarate hydratase [Lachnospiraceae bacterium]